MFDFGANADYMWMGYAVTVLVLASVIGWMAVRYRTLFREQALIDQLEAEEQQAKHDL